MNFCFSGCLLAALHQGYETSKHCKHYSVSISEGPTICDHLHLHAVAAACLLPDAAWGFSARCGHVPPGHLNRPSKLDVPAFLIGVVAASVAVVIIALLWCCRPNAMRWKIDRSSRWEGRRRPDPSAAGPVVRKDLDDSRLLRRCRRWVMGGWSCRARPRRSNASLIIRRLEELSMQPVRFQQDQPPPDPSGLPTYEEAVASSGPQDAPPPPYPGCGRAIKIPPVASHPTILTLQ